MAEGLEDKPFTTVEIGNPLTDVFEGEYHTRRNAAVAAAAAAAAGAAWYWRPWRDKSKDDRRLRRLVSALGVSGAAGLLAFSGANLWDAVRGTDFSHAYADPQKLKESLGPGASPDLQVVVAGAGNGPWQVIQRNAAGQPWHIVSGSDSRFGKGRYLLVNPHDLKYAAKYMRDWKRAFPGARVRIHGHSHGGAAAYDLAVLAARYGIGIDKLVTLDPIWRFRKREAKPATTRVWNNYVPSEANWLHNGDIYAIIGGRGHQPEGANNTVVTTPKWNDHSSVSGIPDDPGVVRRENERWRRNPDPNQYNGGQDPANWWVPKWLGEYVVRKRRERVAKGGA